MKGDYNMKQYKSESGQCTVKAYRQNHKFCIKVEYTDGTVYTYQCVDKDKANSQFKRVKEFHKDLVLIK